MLKKNRPDKLRWDPEGRKALGDLKTCLCSKPVLASVNFQRPFVLQTDASQTGLGAVLSQEVEGLEHPVLYLSRKLHDNEKHYATVELECLAAKWAMQSLEHYLEGREFTLVTDHAALSWLNSMRNNNARLTRWYLALQTFRYKTIHRPGRLHTNADALSRIGEKDPERPRSIPSSQLRGGVCGKQTVPARNGPRAVHNSDLGYTHSPSFKTQLQSEDEFPAVTCRGSRREELQDSHPPHKPKVINKKLLPAEGLGRGCRLLNLKSQYLESQKQQTLGEDMSPKLLEETQDMEVESIVELPGEVMEICCVEGK
uniref:Uncharacterized protein LOC117348361 n=1 Tax=Geotrypetes seraphini TaxID=260995 RepID=A0A6P8PL01_GEOSA|nr:uncharacterized protein LOC117348361 [Geotrypetes seraphini]